MLAKLDAFAELQSVVAQQALTGDLTAAWREALAAELALAARARDTLLRKGEATAPSADAVVAEPPHTLRDQSRPLAVGCTVS